MPPLAPVYTPIHNVRFRLRFGPFLNTHPIERQFDTTSQTNAANFNADTRLQPKGNVRAIFGTNRALPTGLDMPPPAPFLTTCPRFLPDFREHPLHWTRIATSCGCCTSNSYSLHSPTWKLQPQSPAPNARVQGIQCPFHSSNFDCSKAAQPQSTDAALMGSAVALRMRSMCAEISFPLFRSIKCVPPRTGMQFRM